MRSAPSRSARTRRLLLALALMAGLGGGPLSGPRWTLGLATDTETAASTVTADVLDPPSTVRCTGGLLVCNAGLLARPVLTWTPTADPYATGYVVYRSTTNGSGYVQVASLTGRTTSTWTDTTSGLTIAVTFYYVVRSVAPVWTSTNSNQVAVTIVLGL